MLGCLGLLTGCVFMLGLLSFVYVLRMFYVCLLFVVIGLVWHFVLVCMLFMCFVMIVVTWAYYFDGFVD